MAGLDDWRAETFLREECDALQGKQILIAGCGADGSHAAERLASVGMHNGMGLLVVDFDVFTQPNVGVQVVDVGGLNRNKAEVTAQGLLQKFPGIQVDFLPEAVTAENAASLVAGCHYVVDAIDIAATDASEALHNTAAARGVPVIVPWSLGRGAAAMAFTKPGNFTEWGANAEALAREVLPVDLQELAPLARWLVEMPPGLHIDHLLAIWRGEMHTPTTMDGAAEGGALAARWIAEHAMGNRPLEYPDAVVRYVHGLNTQTFTGQFDGFMRKSLQIIDNQWRASQAQA